MSILRPTDTPDTPISHKSRADPSRRPSGMRFPCQIMGWDETYTLACELVHLIKDSGLGFDIVVAIGRGGYVPARVVCDRMLYNDLTSIKIEHYTMGADSYDEAVVRFPLSTDIQDMRVLVIDDITDTGKTLEQAVEYLAGFRPKSIHTAVLQHKTCSDFVPDFYAETITEWKWIIYPWALYEDLVGFILKILGETVAEGEVTEPVTTGSVRDALAIGYDITVGTDELEEMLLEMEKAGLITGKSTDGIKYWRRVAEIGGSEETMSG
ncbi:MAG: phosphoribosyltransferase [Methanosarcinaceae archaeon]|nr:phosphoribosyltransferase [Methanosarcinaceae archaeon]